MSPIGLGRVLVVGGSRETMASKGVGSGDMVAGEEETLGEGAVEEGIGRGFDASLPFVVKEEEEG